MESSLMPYCRAHSVIAVLRYSSRCHTESLLIFSSTTILRSRAFSAPNSFIRAISNTSRWILGGIPVSDTCPNCRALCAD